MLELIDELLNYPIVILMLVGIISMGISIGYLLIKDLKK